MADDDPFAPLGWRPDPEPPPARRWPWRKLGFGALGLALAGFVASVWIRSDGMGGEPYAIARIERVAPPPKPTEPTVAAAPAVSNETTGSIRAPSGNRVTAAEAETDSGVKVVRSGGQGAPGALIIQVPEALGVQLTPAPDRRLVDRGKFGPLPKIGPDGSRAAEVYARPLVTGADIKPGAPRLAIVIGGMGLSPQATQNAVAKLPGPVTLAFAPYGAELDKQVARAREAGHEVMLQAPMESFDAQSPGPRTLEVAASPEQTLENLHWLMSRFPGYVGVSNFLGAKFTANEASILPVLREITGRGLFYLDDGSSSQSLAQSLAPKAGGAIIRADVVIDAIQKPEAIEAELRKLEALARQKGSAIGVAAGLPATVEQVARFARALEKRGVTLAPVSSLASTRAISTAGN